MDSCPRVAIVVLSWNGYEVTRDCLKSLSQIDYRNYQVILVDNGSTDESAARLALEFPHLIVIRSPQNLGYSGGNNLGIRYALEKDDSYVLLLNNDTLVATDFLTQLIQAAENDAPVGVLNPKILYADAPDRIWCAGGTFNLWCGLASAVGNRRRDNGRYDRQAEVTFATGCALLIKTAVVKQIGLLDERFFLYCEDVDWSYRALRAGFKVLYVPSSVVWHKDSYTVKNSFGKAGRDFYNVRNTILLARKHARAYHWPTVLLSLCMMVGYRTAGYFLRGEFPRIKALFQGIRAGCNDLS